MTENLYFPQVFLDGELLHEVVGISENHAEQLKVTITLNIKRIEIDGTAIRITTFGNKKETRDSGD